METFDRHKVSFVSVTQAFNTASSMGRLILNVLLSFAQFEREMISERTRDKIAAARRKGKWSGGMPVLGYTVENSKLIVDENEAARVREIFRLYLEHKSILTVARILNERGWRAKRWTTHKGMRRGGRPFDKTSVHKVLTNAVYIGKICYKDEVHEGEHQAIVDADVFSEVQRMLERNGKTGGRAVRNKHNALLRGRLRCAACDCGMSHSYSKKGTRLYRYYVCQRAQNKGWQECPSPSLPAGEIERFVIDQLKGIGRDPTLIRDTLAQVRRQTEEAIERLIAEQKAVTREIHEEYSNLGKLAAVTVEGDPRRVESEARILLCKRRMTEFEDELAPLTAELFDETEVVAALADFSTLWGALQPREQARVVELLIEQVTYDGRDSRLSITYRPSGIRMLTAELPAGVEVAV